MDMKQFLYERERAFLSEFASFSEYTAGRSVMEAPCPMRSDFQRDRDRILHSKSFRRLKNKTQVFLSPEGDHYRTRLTHTLDVSQISRSIARVLRLNEDLVEAIALGHDLGHTPFGHAGERALDRAVKKHCGKDAEFEHNKQSLRIVEFLENDGRGLNLTAEVKDGILNHRSALFPKTLEGQVVRIADKIAYINHDIDDSVRGGIIKKEDIPAHITSLVGETSRDRINSMIMSIYNTSNEQNFVKMSDEMFKATYELRAFMFKTVYRDSAAKKEEAKAEKMLELLFDHYMENKDKLPVFIQSIIEKDGLCQAVTDYISSMSDKYAVYAFQSIYVPASWKIESNF